MSDITVEITQTCGLAASPARLGINKETMVVSGGMLPVSTGSILYGFHN